MGGILTVQRSVEQPDETSGLCDRCFLAISPVGTAWPGASPETMSWLWSASTESAGGGWTPSSASSPCGPGGEDQVPRRDGRVDAVSGAGARRYHGLRRPLDGRHGGVGGAQGAGVGRPGPADRAGTVTLSMLRPVVGGGLAAGQRPCWTLLTAMLLV